VKEERSNQCQGSNGLVLAPARRVVDVSISLRRTSGCTISAHACRISFIHGDGPQWADQARYQFH
jgi:hypothetical protein